MNRRQLALASLGVGLGLSSQVSAGERQPSGGLGLSADEWTLLYQPAYTTRSPVRVPFDTPAGNTDPTFEDVTSNHFVIGTSTDITHEYNEDFLTIPIPIDVGAGYIAYLMPKDFEFVHKGIRHDTTVFGLFHSQWLETRLPNSVWQSADQPSRKGEFTLELKLARRWDDQVDVISGSLFLGKSVFEHE